MAKSLSGKSRLVAFLSMHICTLFSEWFVMGFFIHKEWYGSLSCLVFVILVSGVFCAFTAWYAVPKQRGGCLPLKDQRAPLSYLLAVPYGLLQFVVIQLAIDDFRSPQDNAYSDGDASEETAVLGSVRPATNKYHCKAVIGIFEGIPFIAITVYFMWNVRFPYAPPESAPTSCGNPPPTLELYTELILCFCSLCCLTSAGLGLLELDFCSSQRVAERMRKSLLYEIGHGVFRAAEVYFRVAVLGFFLLIIQAHFELQGCYQLWQKSFPYLIVVVDFLYTLIIVVVYSGMETGWVVRILCALIAMFSDIFLFIDSPYKQRAARKLSWFITLRNFLEPLVLVVVTICIFYTHEIQCGEDTTINGVQCFVHLSYELIQVHSKTTSIAILCSVMYWLLLFWVSSDTVHGDRTPDIFSACETGEIGYIEAHVNGAVKIDVNKYEVHGKTALMLAVRGGYGEVVRILLKAGAAVDAKAFEDRGAPLWKMHRGGWTSLHYAASRGHVEITQLLAAAAPRDKAADHWADGSGNTPLHVAVRKNQVQIAAVLRDTFPAWADLQNNKGVRPDDQGTPLRDGQPAPARDVAVVHLPERQEPLVAGERPGAEAGIPRVNSDHSSSSGGTELSQIVSISHSVVDAENKEAPGLCSFLAASSSGVLGHAFLVTSQRKTVARGPLGRIDEDQQLAEDSPDADAEPAAPPVTIDDLDPIDSSGEKVEWWCKIAEVRRRQGNAINGNFVAEVPNEATLGEGSYGKVWRARDRNTDIWYAVKNIKVRRQSANNIALRECEIAEAVMIRPHICVVQLSAIHHFKEACLYSLVMEYCPDGDIKGAVKDRREECRANKQEYTPMAMANSWIAQTFIGLEHLHLQMKTLIRDLKPDNVVLNRGVCKICDFGFCRIGTQSSGQWTFGMPPGTPGYVSPEVLKGEKYNFKADMYSFGVMIWVILSGGLSQQSDPTPPTMVNRMGHGADYKALYNDWQLMREFILKPDRRVAPALVDPAKDLVLQLVAKAPGQRPDHRKARDHPFLQPLRLPRPGARRAEVQAWIQQEQEQVAF